MKAPAVTCRGSIHSEVDEVVQLHAEPAKWLHQWAAPGRLGRNCRHINPPALGLWRAAVSCSQSVQLLLQISCPQATVAGHCSRQYWAEQKQLLGCCINWTDPISCCYRPFTTGRHCHSSARARRRKLSVQECCEPGMSMRYLNLPHAARSSC